jgi:hypothetical protein
MIRNLFMAVLLAASVASAADPEGKARTKIEDLDVPEPIKCYKAASAVDSGMIVGIAIELCGGTQDAQATLTCYALAATPAEDGGLGLHRGGAVDLCKARAGE